MLGLGKEGKGRRRAKREISRAGRKGRGRGNDESGDGIYSRDLVFVQTHNILFSFSWHTYHYRVPILRDKHSEHFSNQISKNGWESAALVSPRWHVSE